MPILWSILTGLGSDQVLFISPLTEIDPGMRVLSFMTEAWTSFTKLMHVVTPGNIHEYLFLMGGEGGFSFTLKLNSCVKCNVLLLTFPSFYTFVSAGESVS